MVTKNKKLNSARKNWRKADGLRGQLDGSVYLLRLFVESVIKTLKVKNGALINTTTYNLINLDTSEKSMKSVDKASTDN